MVLGRSMLVHDHLQSGRLVAPFAAWVKPILSSYYLVSTKEKAALDRVAVFREWILEVAAREVQAGPSAQAEGRVQDAAGF
jgi:DNA-binding transcriptional LysR family regulator